MIDRMVNQGLNQPQESFYFQLIPISLTLVNTGCDLPAQGTTYRFSVFKGTFIDIQGHKSSTKTGFPSQLILRFRTASMSFPSVPAVSTSTFHQSPKQEKLSLGWESFNDRTVLTTLLEITPLTPMLWLLLSRMTISVVMNWSQVFQRTMSLNLKSMLITTGLHLRRTFGIIAKTELSSLLLELGRRIALHQQERDLLKTKKWKNLLKGTIKGLNLNKLLRKKPQQLNPFLSLRLKSHRWLPLHLSLRDLKKSPTKSQS